jgi:hypothetical protein
VTDPLALEAFKFMSPQGVSKAIEFAALPSRMLRAGATWTLEFMGRNVMRDTAFAFIAAGNHPVDFMRGLMRTIAGKAGRFDRMWQKFEAAGGPKSTMVSMDMPTMASQAEDFMRGGGKLYNVLDPKGTAGAWTRKVEQGAEQAGGGATGHAISIARNNPMMMFLHFVSEMSEHSTRMGTFERIFRKSLNEGMTSREAGFEGMMAAKRTTVDFAMHGTVLPSARLLAAFWNPMLQGMDTFARALRDDPVKATMRGFMGITLPSIMLYLHNRNDPEYFQLPDWERNLFWHFKAPEGFPVVGDKWIRLPKPFEPGMVFGSSVERMLQAVDQEDPRELDGFARDWIMGQGMETIPIPTAAKPFLEIAMNRNLFRDRPITPLSQQDVEPRYRSSPGTSDTSKMIGAVLGIDPMQLDHIIYSWTGGLGRQYVGGFLDKYARNPEEIGEAPTEGAHGIAGVRGFVSRFPLGSEPAEEFYDMASRTREAKDTYLHLQRTNRIDEMIDYMMDNAILIQADPRLQGITRQLGDLRQRRLQVQLHRTMDPKQKRELMDSLDQLSLELVSAAAPLVKLLQEQEIASRQW